MRDYLKASADVILQTIDSLDSERMQAAIDAVSSAFQHNRMVLLCGNGGSASDSMHIAGEFVGRFLRERRAFKAICLSSNPAVLTAWANDYDYDTVFSRQVEAYGETDGVIIGLSTSGNSKNVVAAFTQAKKMGMRTIALTGEGGGRLRDLSDILLDVPSRHTPLIQQVHICLYHYLCEQVEARLAQSL